VNYDICDGKPSGRLHSETLTRFMARRGKRT